MNYCLIPEKFIFLPFWKQATTDPPIKWENWRIQVKPSILARENIKLETLFEPKPTRVKFPQNQNMRHPSKTQHNKRKERQIRNSQFKVK